jgi:AcrR family transcriptional regulator
MVARCEAWAAMPEPSRTRNAPVLRQPRAVRTRNQLIATAIRLCRTKDFDDITVDAIVEAAGVSKGTFFYHFRRKEDLLVDLGWATVDRVGEEAEAAYAEGGDLDEALAVGIAGLARRITAMPRGAVGRTIKEFAFERPAARSSVSGRHAFMSGLFHAAQDAGDIPAGIDVDELADVLNHVIIQTILHSVTGRTDEPLEPMLTRRARLVLYGIDDPTAGRGRRDLRVATPPRSSRGDSARTARGASDTPAGAPRKEAQH